jgi:uncharacterized repeat protein (TIGR02543 family)
MPVKLKGGKIMNIFKKALLLVLGAGLLVVPSTVDKVEEVNAAKTTVDTTFYLTPNSNWKQKNARFALYTWDGGDKWFSMTATKGETNLYEVTIPAGIENIIFVRMNPSTTANNWNNKWNQTSDLKYDGTNNHYTVSEGAWDKGAGKWSLYAPAATVYTVNFETNCDQTVAAQEIAEGGLVSLPTLEPTGFEFLGWYTDKDCTKAFDANTKVTSNMTLYAKWGEYTPVVATYNSVVYFENNKNWKEVYCYTWDASSNPAVPWPGVKMNLLEGKTFWTNVVSGQVNVLFHENTGDTNKTSDLKLGTNNYFVWNSNSNVPGSLRKFDSNVYFQRQDSEVVNASDVRFVGTFNGELADYEEIGFVFGSEVAGQFKTTRKATKKVYESVIANGSEVVASELGASYVFVITISGVPAGQTFDVTPYAKTTEGTYVYGTAKTIVVQNA